jgi:hypothetical protein
MCCFENHKKKPTRPDGSVMVGIHFDCFNHHFPQHFPSFSRYSVGEAPVQPQQFPHVSRPCQAMHQQVTWLLLAIEENGALFLGARQAVGYCYYWNL